MIGILHRKVENPTQNEGKFFGKWKEPLTPKKSPERGKKLLL